MRTSRLVLGFGLVLALTIVLMLVTSGSADEPAPASVVTTLEATPSTLIPITEADSAPSSPPTTTLEQREEEVAAILQELYFGWFDAIYRKDSDALREVVATDDRFAAGVQAFSEMGFDAAPRIDDMRVSIHEILLDRDDCLVVYSTLDVSAFRGSGLLTSVVDVLWAAPGGLWRRATVWSSPTDLWLPDCDLRERG